jgi:hypothetical protein
MLLPDETHMEVQNQALWSEDIKQIKTLIPHFAKIYTQYWKCELVVAKEKTQFEREQ